MLDTSSQWIFTYPTVHKILGRIPLEVRHGLELRINFLCADLVLLVHTPLLRRDTFCRFQHRIVPHHSTLEEIIATLREMITAVHASISTPSHTIT